MSTNPKKHLWRVGYSRFPKDEKSGYKHNCLVNVAACTIENAMKVIQDRYPDATVWSINHHGLLYEAEPEVKP